ncbi:Hypothetical protein GbCGDNIH9_8614 [Granulibacter bethesdensis]|uniref:Uncharacterized protein n=1 Tax=Granulibacter bethesdensis TaxID=364410 RepID=A0AAC9KCQ3_9PROT|nr:hypothetical protein [Granulibacter bethesdensis]APH54928.1 Hypothetical protein GbCGDNIH9_8614 [Granulibacter bethesdensis]APH62514.1 Hypothetical protein GbCGDNIH8_8614 [Granulibacter bethesdensis]
MAVAASGLIFEEESFFGKIFKDIREIKGLSAQNRFLYQDDETDYSASPCAACSSWNLSGF